MKSERQLIPVKWKDVRFEELKISHIGLQQSISYLPQQFGERCDKRLRLNPLKLRASNRFLVTNYNVGAILQDAF